MKYHRILMKKALFAVIMLGALVMTFSQIFNADDMVRDTTLPRRAEYEGK